MVCVTAQQAGCKRGAGVIPFAVHDQRVQFLFQTTFSGRKRGFLTDFGGGSDPGEDAHDTAVREFVEETETLYFAKDLDRARRSAVSVGHQIALVADLFEQTLSSEPGWRCRRRTEDAAKPKHWTTFFIEFPYRDIAPLNRQWEADTDGRFRKRRALVWVRSDRLVTIYNEQAGRLWKRVRQLENAPAVIDAIRQSREA